MGAGFGLALPSVAMAQSAKGSSNLYIEPIASRGNCTSGRFQTAYACAIGAM